MTTVQERSSHFCNFAEKKHLEMLACGLLFMNQFLSNWVYLQLTFRLNSLVPFFFFLMILAFIHGQGLWPEVAQTFAEVDYEMTAKKVFF